ncbi:hypothetical protein EV11_0408 [Prochlorococcus sp. SS52]|nr:hypothetical protein EV04_0439 [Prochlorococcus marinus str. LG]KGG19087.1 hypothetical protein EV08_1574 [Prochlorococcus marinus str. SS2]KGG23373.1 hypothetical protein EV09_0997 [Prochlorococcus marinus str. SS35]KGG32391.1 hypothetical protein EV10_1506 [Prochlorococcus marinus str. SS51]KGG36977.1 hypothetical protein EV11_0408 [Prochlorococcus sp. SS52]
MGNDFPLAWAGKNRLLPRLKVSRLVIRIESPLMPERPMLYFELQHSENNSKKKKEI